MLTLGSINREAFTKVIIREKMLKARQWQATESDYELIRGGRGLLMNGIRSLNEMNKRNQTD